MCDTSASSVTDDVVQVIPSLRAYARALIRHSDESGRSGSGNAGQGHRERAPLQSPARTCAPGCSPSCATRSSRTSRSGAAKARPRRIAPRRRRSPIPNNGSYVEESAHHAGPSSNCRNIIAKSWCWSWFWAKAYEDAAAICDCGGRHDQEPRQPGLQDDHQRDRRRRIARQSSRSGCTMAAPDAGQLGTGCLPGWFTPRNRQQTGGKHRGLTRRLEGSVAPVARRDRGGDPQRHPKRGAGSPFARVHGPSGKRIRYDKTVPGIGSVKTEDILSGYDLGDDTYLLIRAKRSTPSSWRPGRPSRWCSSSMRPKISPLYYKQALLHRHRPMSWPKMPTGRARRAAQERQGAAWGRSPCGAGNTCARCGPCGDGAVDGNAALRGRGCARPTRCSPASEDDEADPDLLVGGNPVDRAQDRALRRQRLFTTATTPALRKLIDAKKSNRKTPRTSAADGGERPKGANVVDLMQALQDSLKGQGGKPKAAAKPAAKAPAKAPRQTPSKSGAKPVGKTSRAKGG